MILSMTGYGQAQKETSEFQISAESRSLNSRQFDLNLKLPSSLRHIEADIRQKAQKALSRGKVEISIHLQGVKASSNYTINKPLFEVYYNQLKGLSDQFELKEDLLSSILRMPEIITQEEKPLSDDVVSTTLTLVDDALANLLEHRKKEGESMQADLMDNLLSIEQRAKEMQPFEAERNERLKSRLSQQLEQWKSELDESRYHQEVVYYLEKWDINEEKVRLAHHIGMFREEMENGEKQGRKLNFITQEIGREINTMGSKCQNADMQKRVVEMKDHLEQIKEQLGNIL